MELFESQSFIELTFLRVVQLTFTRIYVTFMPLCIYKSLLLPASFNCLSKEELHKQFAFIPILVFCMLVNVCVCVCVCVYVCVCVCVIGSE